MIRSHQNYGKTSSSRIATNSVFLGFGNRSYNTILGIVLLLATFSTLGALAMTKTETLSESETKDSTVTVSLSIETVSHSSSHSHSRSATKSKSHTQPTNSMTKTPSVSETVSISQSDSTSPSFTFPTISISPTVTDGTLSLSESTSNTGSNSETFSLSLSSSPSLTDTLSLSLSDSISLSESSGNSPSLSLSYSDPSESLSFSEEPSLSESKNSLSPTITDSLSRETETFSLSTSGSSSLSLSLSDTISISLSDSRSDSASLSPSFSESLSASESPATPTVSAPSASRKLTESNPSPTFTHSVTRSYPTKSVLSKSPATQSSTLSHSQSLSHSASSSSSQTPSGPSASETLSVSLSESPSVSFSMSGSDSFSVSGGSSSKSETLSFSVTDSPSIGTPSPSPSYGTFSMSEEASMSFTSSLSDPSPTMSLSEEASLSQSRSNSLSPTFSTSATLTTSSSVTPSPSSTGTETVTMSHTQSYTGSNTLTGTLSTSETISSSGSTSSSMTPSVTGETLSETVSSSSSRTTSVSRSASLASFSPAVTASKAETTTPSLPLTRSQTLSDNSKSLFTETRSKEGKTLTQGALTVTPSISHPTRSISIGTLTPSIPVTETGSITPSPTGSAETLSLSVSDDTFTTSGSLSEGTETFSITDSGATFTDTESLSVSETDLSMTASDSVSFSVTETDGSFSMSMTGGSTTPTRSGNTESSTVSYSISDSHSDSGSVATQSDHTLSLSKSIETMSISLSMSDSPSGQSPSFSLGDTVSNSLTRSSSFSVSPSSSETRSASASESQSQATVSHSVSDTISVSDNTLSVTETGSATEYNFANSRTRGTLTGTGTDSLSISGTDQSLSITYSISTTMTLSFSFGSASLSISDSFPSPSKSLSLSEEVSMSFSLSPSTSLSPTLSFPSETFSPSLSYTTSLSKTFSLTMTFSLSDSFSPSVSEPTESLSISYSPSPSYSLSLTGTHSLTESPSISLTHSLSPSETHTTTSSESLSVSPSLTPTFSTSPTFTETPTETVSVSPTYTPTNSETVSLTSSLSLTHTASITPTESVTPPSDSRTLPSQTRTFVPSSSVDRDQSRTATFTHTPTETPTHSKSPSHTFTKSLTPSYSLTQTHTLSPSVSRTSSLSASLSLTDSESITRSDSVSHSYSLSHSASGSHTSSESLTPTFTPTVTVSESLSHSESKTLSVSHSLTSSSTLSISDTLTMILTDTVTPTITLTGSATWSLSVSYSGTPRELTPSYTGSADVTLTPSPTPSYGTPSMSFTPSEPTVTYTTSISDTLTKSDTHTGTATLSRQTVSGSNSKETKTYPSDTASKVPTETETESASKTLSTTHSLTPSLTHSQSEKKLTGSQGTESQTFTVSPQTYSMNTGSVTQPTKQLSRTLHKIDGKFTESTTITPAPTRTATDTLTGNTVEHTSSGSLSYKTVTKSPNTGSETPSTTLSLSDGTESFSEDVSMTMSASASNTLTLSITDTVEPTMSETSSHTGTLSQSETFSLPLTMSATITPPPTPSDTVSLTVTESLSDSDSWTETDGSLSLTETLTMSESESKGTETLSFGTLSISTTEGTDSLSESISSSETMHVFKPESNYITSPKNPFDVLPVNRPAHFSFTYSPPYYPGDRAGLVPLGTPCTVTSAITGLPIPHPQMLMMSHSKTIINSNWTITVPSLGPFKVCAYQSHVSIDRWVMLQPSRTVWFGPLIVASEAKIQPLGGPCGDHSTRIWVDGGQSGDVVRLIPEEESCDSAVASTYLTVDSFFTGGITVSGTVPVAGRYNMCYRGYPHQFSFHQFIAGGIIFYGSPRSNRINSANPTLPLTWANVTVLGHGLRPDDEYWLVRSTTPGLCATSHLDKTLRVGTGIPTMSRGREGLTAITVLFWIPEVAGEIVICYQPNGTKTTTVAPVDLPFRISVKAIVATDVSPSQVSYAAGSFASFLFQGTQLDGRYDNATLQWINPEDGSNSIAFSCGNTTSPQLQFNAATQRFETYLSPPLNYPLGSYTICYGTNTSDPVMVSSTSIITIHELFYGVEEGSSADSEFNRLYEGLQVGDSLTLPLRGYGLSMGTTSTVSVVSASTGCPSNQGATSEIPVTTLNQTFFLVSASQVGLFVLCNQIAPGRVLSGRMFSVLPIAPTSISPLVVNAGSESIFSLSGGSQVRLLPNPTTDRYPVDRLGLCHFVSPTNSDTILYVHTYLPASGPSALTYTPDTIGTHNFCIEFGIWTKENTTNVTKLVGSITAIPSTSVSQVIMTPLPRFVGEVLSVSAPDAVGFKTEDSIFICLGADHTPMSLSPPPLLTTISPTNWSIRIDTAGVYSLCHQGVSPNAEVIVLVRDFVVEPKVLTLEPSTVYAALETLVEYTLEGTRDSSILTSFFMGPNCGAEPSLEGGNSNNRTNAGVPLAAPVHVEFSPLNSSDPTSRSFSANVTSGIRGDNLAVCYSTSLGGGTSGDAKSYTLVARAPLSVLPRIKSMGLVSPEQRVYNECPAAFFVHGGSLLPDDKFYLSEERDCQSVAVNLQKTMDNSPNSSSVFSDAQFTAVVPKARQVYFVCGGQTITLATAYSSFDSAASFSYVSPKSSPTSTFDFSYRCIAPAGSSYQFFVSFDLGAKTNGIPLDLPVVDGSFISMKNLPFNYFVVFVKVDLPDGTSRTVEEVVQEDGGSSFCTALPEVVTEGSDQRQFAENFFILYNWIQLACTGREDKDDPSAIMTHVQSLIMKNSSLLVDPALMLPVLTSTLKDTQDPVTQAVDLLEATVPALTPYSPAESGAIDAHLKVARDTLLIVSENQNTGNTTTLHELAQNVLRRLEVVSSVVCSSGTSSLTADEGVFKIRIIKNPPYSDVSQLDVDLTLSATVTMTFGTKEGYCFSSILMPINLVPSADQAIGSTSRRQVGSRITRRQQSTTSSSSGSTLVVKGPEDLPSKFNMPLLAVNADPQLEQFPAPRIKTTRFEFKYGADLAPPENGGLGVDLISEIYLYVNGSWVKDETAIVWHDAPLGIIHINVTRPSSGNQALVAGVIGWRLRSPNETKGDVDWVLILMTISLGLFYWLCILAARYWDIRSSNKRKDTMARVLQSTGRPMPEAPVDYEEMIGHRYQVLFKRHPEHPTNTPFRVSAAFAYLFALFGIAILLATSGQRPNGSDLLGLPAGLLCALIATPIGTIARALFSSQTNELPSFVAAGAAIVVGFPLTFFLNYITGAAAVAGLGVVIWFIAVFAYKDQWFVESSVINKRFMIIIAWVSWVALYIGVVVLGIVYGIQGEVPQVPGRDTYQVVSSFFFGFLIDLVLLEPIKFILMAAIYKKIVSRYQNSRSASARTTTSAGAGRSASASIFDDEERGQDPDQLTEVDSDGEIIHAPQKLRGTRQQTEFGPGTNRRMIYEDEYARRSGDEEDELEEVSQAPGDVDSLYAVNMDFDDAVTVHTTRTTTGRGGVVDDDFAESDLYTASASPASKSAGRYSRYGKSSSAPRPPAPGASWYGEDENEVDKKNTSNDNLSEIGSSVASESTGFYEVAPSSAFNTVRDDDGNTVVATTVDDFSSREGEQEDGEVGDALSEVDSAAFETAEGTEMANSEFEGEEEGDPLSEVGSSVAGGDSDGSSSLYSTDGDEPTYSGTEGDNDATDDDNDDDEDEEVTGAVPAQLGGGGGRRTSRGGDRGGKYVGYD